MKINVTATDYHRNGISGVGFNVALFDCTEDGVTRKMVGVTFPEAGECAVFDIAELAKGNIAFARGNSFRGDHFEGALRKATADAEAAERAAFDAKYGAAS